MKRSPMRRKKRRPRRINTERMTVTVELNSLGDTRSVTLEPSEDLCHRCRGTGGMDPRAGSSMWATHFRTRCHVCHGEGKLYIPTIGEWVRDCVRYSGGLLCWNCGRQCQRQHAAADYHEVHHIERKSHFDKRRDHPCNWYSACRECHQGPLDSMPHARQLAAKFVFDPVWFSLSKWLELRHQPGKHEQRLTEAPRVTAAEVAAEVLEITEERPALNGQPLDLDRIAQEIEET